MKCCKYNHATSILKLVTKASNKSHAQPHPMVELITLTESTEQGRRKQIKSGEAKSTPIIWFSLNKRYLTV